MTCRISLDESLTALALAEAGQLEPSKGEPDAERLERRLEAKRKETAPEPPLSGPLKGS